MVFLFHLGLLRGSLSWLKVELDLIVVAFSVSSQFDGIELNLGHNHGIDLLIILAVIFQNNKVGLSRDFLRFVYLESRRISVAKL